MKDMLRNTHKAMADYYRQYINGDAYIPLQDLPRYERAFKKIYK